MASSPSLSREGHGIARDAMALFAVKDLYATETAAGTVTLDDTYPSIVGIDPGGAGRDVTLDAEATSDGLTRVIVNRADAARSAPSRRMRPRSFIATVLRGPSCSSSPAP